MKQQHADYEILPYSKVRRLEAIAYHAVQHKPMMHGLLEVDVTRARAFIQAYKAKTGESLSFTAFLIACMAKAVEEHKAVQAYRKGSKHIIVFDDVDVYTPIEREVASQKQLVPYVIRAANRKTFREIHQEIRTAQVKDMTHEWERFNFINWPWLLLLPVFHVMVWIGLRSPQVWRRTRGTVGITAVGMFGKGAGWGIPLPSHSLWITVGGIGEKPMVVEGHITTREYLSLTVSFDHDVIDGAPAARFTQRLKELIESGYGLDDLAVEPMQVIAEGASN
ncbi:MAG TPA: 2-oxo acid dehydrogenase subunit E2 [Ktedonobacteraceae bacterium]|jgi:pyruvate/2-oxoglutarate dehydrogenase complex dihydrolipoamide acyltransferase (E2) component|nr:2-oxo acid dehydrogenase subunit E2 [Ktedonobacteraceae bacterium]